MKTETAKLAILKKYTLLCVEDDLESLGQLSLFFSRYFAKVYTAATARDGWELFCQHNQDVVCSDIVLGGEDGVWLVKKIKQASPSTVSVFLSGKTDTDTLIETIGIKPLGFITKPIRFSVIINFLSKIVDELDTGSLLLEDGIEIDFRAMQIKNNGEVSDITAKEAQMLKLLADNQGHTVSYDTINRLVWDDDEMSESSLKSLLYRIRSKIGKEKIKTMSGVGIRLEF